MTSQRTRLTGGAFLLLVWMLAVCARPAAAAPSLIAFALDTDEEGHASRIYVAGPDGSGLKAVTSGTTRDRGPAFSPDGKAVAYQSANSLGLDTVMVQELDEGKP